MPRHASFARSRRLARAAPVRVIALLLQGGGALGSYQAGVYEALAEADLHPDWVAGHLDRRHQLRHHRRQRADRAGGQAARLLGGDHHRSAARLGRCGRRVHSQGRPRARRLQPDERGQRARQRRSRLFCPAQPAPWLYPAVPSRRPAFTKPSPSRRRSSGSSTSTGSMPARCASASARSTCAPAISSTSTTPRTRSAPST